MQFVDMCSPQDVNETTIMRIGRRLSFLTVASKVLM